MAGIDTGGGHGDRKSVNQEIPLVPFIDFLLCCVMFLLVTAVWNQLARIETRNELVGETLAGDEEPPAIRRLLVRADGYTLVIGDESRVIPRLGSELDRAELARSLRALVQADPRRDDLVVEPADGVRYLEIVEAMDTSLDAGLSRMSLSPIAIVQ